MQKLARLSFALLFLLATTPFAPPAKAQPCATIVTIFYDCHLNQVGIKYRGCDGSSSDEGTLSGAFKEIVTSPCTCGSDSDDWYQWNGSMWVGLPGQPSPSC